MPRSLDEIVRDVSDSGLLAEPDLRAWLDTLPADNRPQDGEQFARELVRQKKLTKFQAEQVFAGKGKSLTLVNYVILDKPGHPTSFRIASHYGLRMRIQWSVNRSGDCTSILGMWQGRQLLSRGCCEHCLPAESWQAAHRAV